MLQFVFADLLSLFIGGENVTEEGSIDPLSLTPEGHDELLDDEAKGDDEDINMSYEEDGPVADLASILEELLKNLEMDSHRRLSSSMSADVEDYGTATFLDLSSVCFPNLLITGEGKKTNMRSAAVQATVHMRQQRRTQPWLRFCLGLMATKDEMGLLRADGTGVEKFIFPKNLGHGVFESIRLSLGILLATDQELGQHPSFYLRSVTKFRPTIPSTPTNFPDIPHRLISREVNWIILQEEKLHGKHLFDRAPTVFYVKHLIEDRGSLVGRCTRVWCVYQEVFNSDPLFNRYRNVLPAGSCVMKGPYALKAYNADMSFEAYEQDVLVKIMDQHRTKPLDGVLLPTHVWHFGDILTLVRGLTQDNCPSTISLDRIKNSQEVFTVSALKRTLSQFETIEEFYGAIIGVLQGIESLEAIKIIHRDISFGNIILNKEIYCDTDRELEWIDVDGVDGKPSRVALLRRETVDIGTVGGLHDLDMATYIPETVFIKRLEWPHASIQTQNVTSSKPVSTVQQELVRESRITDALPLWSTTRNKTLKRIHWDMLASFHEQLWIYMENIGVHISTPFRDNEEVRPSSIRAVLQKILESLDMDSEIPA
ncbi:hypothetical protein C0992_012810 [Termitomyces sp. T32_za158]|nr:hypothetical protein C0992_012810 [Termitomyces sp. T32_za158]